MTITRRQFIQSGCALLVVNSLGACQQHEQRPNEWLISAFSQMLNGQLQHYVGAFSQSGQMLSHVAMPGRCHQVIAHPNKPGHVVVFARRPGQFVIEIDMLDGVVTHTINAPEHQHVFGHGVFSTDGQLLLYTSNDYQKGQGLVSVRRSDNYQLVTQYPSGGIGPHELLLHPNREQLIIANGGILTHPNQPRKKLNLDTMAPNLSYLNISSGQIDHSVELDNHQLSIRHLAVCEQGKVVVGLQYQGAKTDQVPLVFSHQGQQKPKYLYAPPEVWPQMKQYTASVAINSDSQVAAVSCPRGNLVTYWDIRKDKYIGKQRVRDCAGVTLVAKYNGFNFAKTSGDGQLQIGVDKPYRLKGIRFDNHLSKMKVS